MYVVDLSGCLAIASVLSDEDAFLVNKLSTSLLVNVFDLEASPAMAHVISNEDAVHVNK